MAGLWVKMGGGCAGRRDGEGGKRRGEILGGGEGRWRGKKRTDSGRRREETMREGEGRWWDLEGGWWR